MHDSTFADYSKLMRLYREMDTLLESGLITIDGLEVSHTFSNSTRLLKHRLVKSEGEKGLGRF